MKAIVVIWIIATYILFGICQVRVGSGGAGGVQKSLIVCVIVYYKFHLNKNLKNFSFIMDISHAELL